MRIIKAILVLFIVMNIDLDKVFSKQLVSTDYIHSFEYNIENIIDDNIDTFFVMPDFNNYLEFKLEPNKHVKDIKFIFDSVYNNYEYKIYSSEDGYRYYNVEFTKNRVGNLEEIVTLDIKSQFVKIHITNSNSKDFIHIKEVYFLDKVGNKIENVSIEKEDPIIENIMFKVDYKGYVESIKGLISRTLGKEYTEFFDIVMLPDKFDEDYFKLYSSNGRITIAGNNVNSIAVALNYYFEHYLNQTFNRFGDSKIKVNLPLKPVEGIIEKKIDIKYRFNYNYVAYGYTMAYWDFYDWEREIDWMALNGFNIALNLVAHEEVIR